MNDKNISFALSMLFLPLMMHAMESVVPIASSGTVAAANGLVTLSHHTLRSGKKIQKDQEVVRVATVTEGEPKSKNTRGIRQVPFSARTILQPWHAQCAHFRNDKAIRKSRASKNNPENAFEELMSKNPAFKDEIEKILLTPSDGIVIPEPVDYQATNNQANE